jgi:23S rRNA (cytidine1920-2'-O)/16S rRNA (cytidine1409-2'-O)-methyltransferase
MRQRLDDRLVELGHYASRSRARDAILRGTVSVDGAIAQKPGQTVSTDAIISIDDPAQAYVSRAALKLLLVLDKFGLSPKGCQALDIGASTGGFTQVLLERGASHVTAIDVGHGQIDPLLRHDPRVTVIEGLNARELDASHLAERPSFITCDVSFISATLALQPALKLALPGAKAVILIKPQFELGREALDRHGVVKDAEAQTEACRKIAQWLARERWTVIGETPSPVQGGDGNREFLIAAEKPC